MNVISVVELSCLVGVFTHRNVDHKALFRIARVMELLLDATVSQAGLHNSARCLLDEIVLRSDMDTLRRAAAWESQIAVFKDGDPSFLTETQPSTLESLLGIGFTDKEDWPAIERLVIEFHKIATASEVSAVNIAFDNARKLVREIYNRDDVNYLRKFTLWSDEYEEGYLEKTTPPVPLAIGEKARTLRSVNSKVPKGKK